MSRPRVFQGKEDLRGQLTSVRGADVDGSGQRRKKRGFGGEGRAAGVVCVSS